MYNAAYVKCHIQKYVPSARFETHDEEGRLRPANVLHCVVPPTDVAKLEMAVKRVGKIAVWPLCPNIGGMHREITV